MSLTAQTFTDFDHASSAVDHSAMMVVENVLDRWQLTSNLWIVEFDALHEGVCIRDTVAFTSYAASLRFGRGSLVSCSADPDECNDELPF